MDEILMYISIAIKVIILIILIAILFKITSVSSVKTIEKFGDNEDLLKLLDPRGDKTLTLKEANDIWNFRKIKLSTYDEKRIATIKSIKLDEITNLVKELKLIEDKMARGSISIFDADKDVIKQTYTITYPPRKKGGKSTSDTYTDVRVIDATKILENVEKIINGTKYINLDTYRIVPTDQIDQIDQTPGNIVKLDFNRIKEITDYIVYNANKARYYYYNYFLESSDYDININEIDNKILPIYQKLRSVLNAMTDTNRDIKGSVGSAIDSYLFAKAFIDMKKGTEIYEIYDHAFKKNNPTSSGYHPLPFYLNNIKFVIDSTLYYDTIITKQVIPSYVRRSEGYDVKSEIIVLDPINKYSDRYFYVWRLYDVANNNKLIATGPLPEIQIINKKKDNNGKITSKTVLDPTKNYLFIDDKDKYKYM